jgi:pimeloyl-ACP methyl ester carboxylesterase
MTGRPGRHEEEQMTTPHTVRSADGTTIAYEVAGAGPCLVLVHGSVSDRTYWAPVVPTLARRYTVVSVDRRGRGGSGDTEPYAVAREAEDLMAVVDAFAEPVHLFGHSYGGLIALEAARQLPDLGSLRLYEPAIGLQGAVPEAFIAQVEALVDADRRDDATALMMGEVVGLPGDVLAELRADAAAWQPMVDCMHTLPRELRTVMGFTFDAGRYAGIEVPTVLLAGTESPPELHVGIDLVSEAVAGTRTVTMEGVDHEAVTTGPDVLVEAILDSLPEVVR